MSTVVMLSTKDTIGFTTSIWIASIHAPTFEKSLVGVITTSITLSYRTFTERRITFFNNFTLMTYSFKVVKTI